MPMPISVHMFGLRVMTDCAQRRKNGQPAHSTTGVPIMWPARAPHVRWNSS